MVWHKLLKKINFCWVKWRQDYTCLANYIKLFYFLHLTKNFFLNQGGRFCVEV